MGLTIYGEIGIDILLDSDARVIPRIGGAGLYASLSAARQEMEVEFITIYGPEVDSYSLDIWSLMGISFAKSKYIDNYSIPRYLVKGYKAYEHKKSTPMTDIRIGLEHQPTLSTECQGILVFPVDHSLPSDLCRQAFERDIPVFLDPKPNNKSIDDARSLLDYVTVLLVNEEEALLLAQKTDLENAINILRSMGPKYVIVKRGHRGCIVSDERQSKHIPAFKSNVKCTLGSGDVFGGALAATFIRTGDIEYSTKLASCVASNFIEGFSVEAVINKAAAEEDMNSREIILPRSTNKTIYLASPFFNKPELDWVTHITNRLENANFKVLSPSRENGIINKETTLIERQRIFEADIELLKKSDVVVALLDNSDPGTCFEIGMAYEKGIPIIALKTSQNELNNMLLHGCDRIINSVEGLIEELYEL